jgi:gluconate kinase
MRNKFIAVAIALLVGAPMLAGCAMLAHADGAEALAADDLHATGSVSAVCSARKAATSDWLRLHRPDGEIVHIKADQIVFVTSAAATAVDKRARSKIQLLNGFSDVRESVEEVMRAIQTDASKQISTR